MINSIPQVSKVVQKLRAKKVLSEPQQSHHSGKGTKARINTIAEKHFFKTQVSD